MRLWGSEQVITGSCNVLDSTAGIHTVLELHLLEVPSGRFHVVDVVPQKAHT